MDFTQQYQQYEQKLNDLKNACSQAEKQSIIAETNLANLRQQREQLIEECETFTGSSIDAIPEILNTKKQEFEAMMSRLSAIDVSPNNITDETLKSINDLIHDYNIPLSK